MSKQTMEIKKSKPIWEFWYSGCAVQQIYLILSVLAGLILAVYVILLASLKINDMGYNQNIVLMELFEKYKTRIILYLVFSFFISYIVNNLILVQYCNLGIKGGKNLLWSILIFFLVLPSISAIISSLLGYILLKDMIDESRKIIILPSQ